MIYITPKEEDVLRRYLSGQDRMDIAKDIGHTIQTIRAMLLRLSTKGLLKRVGPGRYEPTGAEYELVEAHWIAKQLEVKPIRVNVSTDLLEYIKGHYPLYQNHRGKLAKKLGISRTVLNQIVIEHIQGGAGA